MSAIGGPCGNYPIDRRTLYYDAATHRDMNRGLVEELVRLRLRDHRLPEGRAVAIRETSGDGRQCEACDAAIGPKEKAVLAMVSLEWMSVRFHVDCYKVWDAERLALSEQDGDGRGSQ
jgi:hypothetical protein